MMISPLHFNPGKLEIFTGPMRSGKTRELLNRIDKLNYMNGYNFLLIKPELDTRNEHVETRFGKLSFPCQFVDEKDPEEILKIVKEKDKLVAIDEVNFFSDGIVEVVEELLKKDKNVLVSGLTLNFRGEIFGSMGKLLARADEVHKLKAVCCYKDCNEPATRTQRLVNGKPAPYDAPLILIGDEEEGYEPRCLKHHKVPRNNKRKTKKIVICASVKKENEILKWKEKLEKSGFEVIKYPKQINKDFLNTYKEEFKNHYQAISKADAILALNYDQKGISGYVGAGTFAEMAFALGLDRSVDVFYSHPLPKEELSYSDELNWWKELGWIKRIDI